MSSEPGWGVWFHAVRPLPELAALGRVAEDLGASAIIVADEGTDRDVFLALAGIGQATEHVALVAGITNPHSRHPVAVAAAFGSLEELAPGRVVVGLGAGGSLVFDPMGLRPRRPYTALAEAVDVINDLLAGKTVDHDGEFSAHRAALPWTPRRLPLAIAGRGPRVERLAAERADWVLLAGKGVAEVPALAARVRAQGAAVGRQPWIVWNPAAGWTPEHVDRIRPHFAYMTVDLPPAELEELGIDDETVSRLRETVHGQGTEAAAALVPDTVLQRYAVVGDRERVVARLSEGREQARPELLAFTVADYSTEFIEDAAAIARDAGYVGYVGPTTTPILARPG